MRLIAAIAAICLAGLLVAGCGGAPPSPGLGRVVVLGFDGMDPEAVRILVDEGRLPHFARLIEEGAFGDLATLEPMLSPRIWTTVATGYEPARHGITDFVVLDRETGREVPIPSVARREPALWNRASDAGRRVAVVAWWATWPAEPVRGVLVSDRFGYHFLHEETGAAAGLHGLAWPPDRLDEVLRFLPDVRGIDPAGLRPFVEIDPATLPERPDFEDPAAHFLWAWSTAIAVDRLSRHLWKTDRPDLLLAYVEATDTISHLFGHLWRVEGLGGRLAADQRRWGAAVDAVYVLADRMLGRFMDTADARTTIVVLSDHGFRLGQLPDDPRKAGHPLAAGARQHRAPGILGLWGARVRRGARPRGARVHDIAPTVLALLGLPAATDMPGRVLDEVVDVDVPPRVPPAPWTPPETLLAEAEGGAATDDALIEHLRSLGYVGGGAPPGRQRGGERYRPTLRARLLATRDLVRAGRIAEALETLRGLEREAPDVPPVHGALGTVLGMLGRPAEALEQFDRAIELSPATAVYHYDRAIALLELERYREARAAAERALSLDPGLAEARRMLEQLGPPRPVSPNRQLAARIARRAAEAARKGNLDEAENLLDEAAWIDPGLPLVPKYRANIACLRGDRDGMVRHFREALALDPDDPVVRHNLRILGALPGHPGGPGRGEGPTAPRSPGSGRGP